MECKYCLSTFGKQGVRPELTTVSYQTVSTPIVGIQDEINGQILWDLDYEDETEIDGEILEYYYSCSFCGEKITEDDVKKILEETK